MFHFSVIVVLFYKTFFIFSPPVSDLMKTFGRRKRRIDEPINAEITKARMGLWDESVGKTVP
ncbi:hypothetical protein SOASR016_05700 [Pectobacterium carotovorum subsp. carotovorum]|uniref:Uncharacterized protein n=1 Tax=Pectobacterium carotovorum subsp. carotovorum TaxID=555 RepID=A0ABQ5L1J1_PECCC|nr:hypothetical protein SOASR016_05700 [Pectobacterium carotovorum subsp. carotovorum]